MIKTTNWLTYVSVIYVILVGSATLIKEMKIATSTFPLFARAYIYIQ